MVEDSGQAGTQIEVTPAMIEAGVWALLDWVADGRSERVSRESLEIGVRRVLAEALSQSHQRSD